MRTRPEGLKSTSESEGEEEEQDKVAEAPQPVPVPKRSAVGFQYLQKSTEITIRKRVHSAGICQKCGAARAICRKPREVSYFLPWSPGSRRSSSTRCKSPVFPAGSRVITQGDRGDQLFLVDSGVLDCHRADEAGVSTHLVSYGPEMLSVSSRYCTTRLEQRRSMLEFSLFCFLSTGKLSIIS